MARYRRKGTKDSGTDVIFANEWDTCGRRKEKAFFASERGDIERWWREDFDREYERVEEKPKGCCSVCGKRLVPGTAFRDKEDSATRFCYDCWQARKKPTPLTLADLKPGDVFRLSSDHFCQAEHQMLSAEEFWCPRDGRAIKISRPDRKVNYLRHYTLTPKQLLWIDATPEERKALEESIRDKWLPIMRGEKRDCGGLDCPCCQLAKHRIGNMRYRPGGCSEACLIGRAAPGGLCGGGRHHDTVDGGYPAERAFTLWLAEFLPNIHPLRIEVEATPVEWPGAKK